MADLSPGIGPTDRYVANIPDGGGELLRFYEKFVHPWQREGYDPYRGYPNFGAASIRQTAVMLSRLSYEGELCKGGPASFEFFSTRDMRSRFDLSPEAVRQLLNLEARGYNATTNRMPGAAD